AVRPRRTTRGHLPPVGDDPFRWKERHVPERLLVPARLRLPRWVTLTGAGCLSVLLMVAQVATGARVGAPEDVPDPDRYVAVLAAVRSSPFLLSLWGFWVAAASAVVAAAGGASTIQAERDRQTWEALLLAGAQPADIVGGKLGGVLDRLVPVA